MEWSLEMGRSRPHLQPYRNVGYDPFVDREEHYVRCSVCQFAGIDAMKWQEPEEATFTTVTTGSTYQPPAGTPIDQLHTVIDRATEIRYVPFASCPHCGAANWGNGSAPDLLR